MSDMKGISSQEIAKSLRQCTMAGGGSNACAECALHGRDFEQDCFDELNCMAASAIEGLQAQLRAVEDQRNALLEENRLGISVLFTASPTGSPCPRGRWWQDDALFP